MNRSKSKIKQNLLNERTIDPLKEIKYYNKIKIMVPLDFEPGDNPLPVTAPVPTPSPWLIQAKSPFKMNKSFALILESLKSK